MKTPLILASAYLAFLTASVLSQDRQGNIVEYFGKEKVTTIREGEVLHTFAEGLVLAGRRFSLNSESTPKQPVVASLLLDDNFTIEEGKAFGVGRDGEALKWESLEVDEKNEFSDRRLRSGYLYLEYEASEAQTVLLDASGHTKAFVNGMPHEGDHYDYGWSLIPTRLKPGTNTFLFTGGRFPRMRARLLAVEAPIQLTPRDSTLPDLLSDEKKDLLGAVRVINASDRWFENGQIECAIDGERSFTECGTVSPLNTRKVMFKIPSPEVADEDKVTASIVLRDDEGTVLSELEVNLGVRSSHAHHKRTFVSAMDDSVQYFGVVPPSVPDLEDPAMILSVHGASVEATGQAAAYQAKDWGYVVAPTNRRAFGFAWEDWGRLDALEVLQCAEELFQTNRKRTYLTGHSMGGHGTWYLGATYPDRFAALGPAAGYPDLLEYRNSFRRRLRNASDEDLKRFGMTRERAQRMLERSNAESEAHPEMDAMIRRAGNPSRTLKLKRNYLHHGIYVLHGEKDTVVPTFLAREMREVLGGFHPDFAYYEYPGGTHWYGNHSVDWKPLFDFFEFRQIPDSEKIDRLEFFTGSPGVSASSHFITILQQRLPFEIASVVFERGDEPSISTTNVSGLEVNLTKLGSINSLQLDSQTFEIGEQEQLIFRSDGDTWRMVDEIPKSEKGPHRYGGFKDAFRNRMVLVYATQGSDEETQWNYNRAKHDAETFYYRANGNVELIRDSDFSLQAYQDRNVILYGNRDNHSAWAALLEDCPIDVGRGQIRVGDRQLSGDGYGGYFVYPRPDSDHASVGVVTATGSRGRKAAYANGYLLNGTTFPDVLLVDDTVLRDGLAGVVMSGFFGNDWSVESGEFVWRDEG